VVIVGVSVCDDVYDGVVVCVGMSVVGMSVVVAVAVVGMSVVVAVAVVDGDGGGCDVFWWIVALGEGTVDKF